MAKILIVAHDQPGHLNPTWNLAKNLMRNGHRISYAIPYYRKSEYVQKAGFPCVSLAEALLGDDTIISTRFETRKGRIQIQGLIKTFLSAVIEADRSESLTKELPDLCLVDATLPTSAMIFHHLRVPVILFCTSFPFAKNAHLPPLSSAIIPINSYGNRLRISLSWLWVSVKRNIKKYGDALRGVQSESELEDAPLRKLRRAWDIPKTFFSPGLFAQVPMLQTMVFCPKILDFPNNSDARYLYTGSNIDIERDEAVSAFPWNRISSGRPLIYCGFGSQTWSYPHLFRIAGMLISVVSRSEKWQLVMSVGRIENFPSVGALPDHIYIVDHAPQIALLKQANLMITHGGLNSIKEAIWFGVPMIVIPQAYDQFGNGARVAYHGIGATMRKVTEASLEQTIERIGNDRDIRANIDRFSKAFRSEDSLELTVRTLESLLPQEFQ